MSPDTTSEAVERLAAGCGEWVAPTLRALVQERDALKAEVREARAKALEEAEDAAHNAVHDAIYEMTECGRVKDAVAAAIRALAEPQR
jgi:hypothetical protein